jgi:hypothetical protein
MRQSVGPLVFPFRMRANGDPGGLFPLLGAVRVVITIFGLGQARHAAAARGSARRCCLIGAELSQATPVPPNSLGANRGCAQDQAQSSAEAPYVSVSTDPAFPLPLPPESVLGPAVCDLASGRIWSGATIHADLAALAMADLGQVAAAAVIAGFITSHGRFVDADQAQAAFGIRSMNMTARGTSGLGCEAALVRGTPKPRG